MRCANSCRHATVFPPMPSSVSKQSTRRPAAPVCRRYQIPTKATPGILQPPLPRLEQPAQLRIQMHVIIHRLQIGGAEQVGLRPAVQNPPIKLRTPDWRAPGVALTALGLIMSASTRGRRWRFAPGGHLTAYSALKAPQPANQSSKVRVNQPERPSGPAREDPRSSCPSFPFGFRGFGFRIF